MPGPRRPWLRLVLPLCLFAPAAAVFAADTSAPASANLLANGDFSDAPGGRPAHWPAPSEVRSYPEEDGNRFLRLIAPRPGVNTTVHRSVPLPAGVEALELSFKVRHEGIAAGEKKWYDGRIISHFKDAAGKVLASPPPPSFKGDGKAWRPAVRQMLVPKGAVKYELQFALFLVNAGTLDFDDIVVRTIPAALVPPSARRIGDTVVPAPDPSRLPPALRVKGNKIVDDNGGEVWLQGVSIASLEWSVGGDNVLQSVDVAIDDWKANCIRLPVKATYWFGRVEGQTDGGAEYRRNIDSVIHKITGRGAYVVLDLHRFRAVTDDDLVFWRDAGARYKDNPGVLYEIFNEPYNIDWKVWRDGGTVTEKKKAPPGVPPESTEMADVSFESPGTQKLVDAIRETGAANILIVGALDYSYDLSGILKGFAIKEHANGRGIVYSSHVYPWKRNWREKFLDVAERHPVFIGECGAPDKPMPFQKPENFPDPHAWSVDFLAMVQERRIHWTGWCFHTRAGPKMLEDWRYKPTDYWGAYAKRALNGEKFVSQRLW